jgi:hypothetical protein
VIWDLEERDRKSAALEASSKPETLKTSASSSGKDASREEITNALGNMGFSSSQSAAAGRDDQQSIGSYADALNRPAPPWVINKEANRKRIKSSHTVEAYKKLERRIERAMNKALTIPESRAQAKLLDEVDPIDKWDRHLCGFSFNNDQDIKDAYYGEPGSLAEVEGILGLKLRSRTLKYEDSQRFHIWFELFFGRDNMILDKAILQAKFQVAREFLAFWSSRIGLNRDRNAALPKLLEAAKWWDDPKSLNVGLWVKQNRQGKDPRPLAAPKTGASKTGASKTDAPKIGESMTFALKTDAPKVDAPKPDAAPKRTIYREMLTPSGATILDSHVVEDTPEGNKRANDAWDKDFDDFPAAIKKKQSAKKAARKSVATQQDESEETEAQSSRDVKGKGKPVESNTPDTLTTFEGKDKNDEEHPEISENSDVEKPGPSSRGVKRGKTSSPK